jgi:hypothetical protein
LHWFRETRLFKEGHQDAVDKLERQIEVHVVAQHVQHLLFVLAQILVVLLFQLIISNLLRYR